MGSWTEFPRLRWRIPIRSGTGPGTQSPPHSILSRNGWSIATASRPLQLPLLAWLILKHPHLASPFAPAKVAPTATRNTSQGQRLASFSPATTAISTLMTSLIATRGAGMVPRATGARRAPRRTRITATPLHGTTQTPRTWPAAPTITSRPIRATHATWSSTDSLGSSSIRTARLGRRPRMTRRPSIHTTTSTILQKWHGWTLKPTTRVARGC
mmetsp:Transcript_36490/g.109648  ORF Transcript_36490/g.109648 Transcript_36490/m.109648 type:complete len:213 (+) Transcript_36490:504-1142(+)